MNWIKELYLYVSNHWIIILINTIILCGILGLIYLFILFTQDLTKVDNQYQNVYSGKNYYQIVDNLVESDSFYAFRHSEPSMKSLKQFYDALEDSQTFDYITTFDQPIKMLSSDFKGDKNFKYGEESDFEEDGKRYSEVKSLQLNRKAFDTYQFKVSDGMEIEWDKVDYANRKIPVLLGASYKTTYAVGDTLKGEFYFSNYAFQVVGFLEENTTLFYYNEINFNIDEYIILPYPEKGYEKLDKEFRGILYFAMVNGNIVTHDKKNDTEGILNQLSQIAKKTGYNEYTIMGVPEFAVQYHTMIATIKDNKNLTSGILVIFLLFATFLLGSLSFFMFRYRKNVYSVYGKLGYTRVEVQGLIFQDLCLPYIISALVLVLYFNSRQLLSWKGTISFILIDLALLISVYFYTLILFKRSSHDKA